MFKNVKKNMGGFAHIQLVIVALVVVAVVGVVGYKVYSNKNSLPSTGINKEAQDKCLAEINDKLLCKFTGVFANIGDYKTTVTSTGAEGTSALELANDSKGNSSMVVKANNQEQANLVLLNGVTYMKDYTDGKWFKFATTDTSKPETLDLKKEFLKSDFKNDSGDKLTYKNLGTEECGEFKCYKYQETDPKKPGETNYLWFDTKSFLLRKLSTDDGKGTKTEMTITYETVSITEPSPIKDAPAATAQ